MKKTILSIAVIAAAFVAASCQKENLLENNASEGSASVFTATIENGADTKTTVEKVTSPSVAYKTYWENTDKISINGVSYTATPDGTDATKATFAKDPDTQTDPTGTFKAYFPEKLFTQIKGNVIISLPETYQYVEGKYNMPMYAESTTTFLSFKNLCGVLAIKVFGKDFTSVTSIEVSSDKQMNGEFTAAADGTLTFKTEGVTLTEDNRKVTLDFASPKSIASDGSATFYIPVPDGTHNPLTIKVFNGTETETMVTNKAGGVKVERKTVYPITFAIYTVTFDLNGITGTAPETKKVAKGGQVTKPTDPADPTDANHTFAGWYKTKDATTGELSDLWDFDNGTVTADMTLYAKWTRTLGSIYSNSDIPKATNNTAPDNAWVNGTGGKAFIAYSGNATAPLYLTTPFEAGGARTLTCAKTQNFTKIGDDYVLDYYLSGIFRGKFTLHMTEGEFTSVTYDGTDTDYEELSGTYAPPAN